MAEETHLDTSIQTIKKPEQFIEIYPNVISKELCSKMITWFNMLSEYGITMTSSEELKETGTGTHRTDECVIIPSGIPAENFPAVQVAEFWPKLQECLNNYQHKYALNQTLLSWTWKVHRVQPSGGYHSWHHEHDKGPFSKRVLVWMIVLEAPKTGGETEFLFQSVRVEPKVGQLIIWPAYFTHKHRGNPPLEGQKTYATGWFVLEEKVSV